MFRNLIVALVAVAMVVGCGNYGDPNGVGEEGFVSARVSLDAGIIGGQGILVPMAPGVQTDLVLKVGSVEYPFGVGGSSVQNVELPVAGTVLSLKNRANGVVLTAGLRFELDPGVQQTVPVTAVSADGTASYSAIDTQSGKRLIRWNQLNTFPAPMQVIKLSYRPAEAANQVSLILFGIGELPMQKDDDGVTWLVRTPFAPAYTYKLSVRVTPTAGGAFLLYSYGIGVQQLGAIQAGAFIAYSSGARLELVNGDDSGAALLSFSEAGTPLNPGALLKPSGVKNVTDVDPGLLNGLFGATGVTPVPGGKERVVDFAEVPADNLFDIAGAEVVLAGGEYITYTTSESNWFFGYTLVGGIQKPVPFQAGKILELKGLPAGTYQLRITNKGGDAWKSANPNAWPGLKQRFTVKVISP